MIETVAIVTRSDSGRVWIKAMPDRACASCAQQSGCGTASLGQWLPKREFAIACALPLTEGDQVRVAIDEAQLLMGSLLAYGVPLLSMLLVVVALPLSWPVLRDWQPELAMSSLLLAFWLLHRMQQQWSWLRRVQPSIIGRC